MLVPVLLTLLALPHGGSFQPPLDPEDPGASPPVPSQPGTGPVTVFQPGRWEWWFDFNQEGLLRLRERMLALPVPEGERPFEAVDDELRLREVLPVLVDALRHRHRDVRASAAMSLGRLNLAAALPYIETMIDDPDLFVRAHAILALGVSGQPAAVEPLAAVLEDERRPAEARMYAAAALGLVGSPESLDVLSSWLPAKRLGAVKNQLRWGLVYAAGVSESPTLVPSLLSLRDSWLWEQDATLRALAAVALGQIGEVETVAPLLELLGDDHNQVRRSAAAGLERAARHLTTDQIREVILHEREENDWAARANLVRALAANPDPVAVAHLITTLRHSATLVRPQAALALGMAGDPAAAPLLLETLADQHEMSTRGSLVVGLGLMQSTEARPVLASLLPRATDPTFAGYLALALGLVGEPTPAVLDGVTAIAAERHDVEAVRLGIVSLGLMGARSRLDALAAGLDDDGMGTMDVAARLFGLGLVGDAPTLEVLLDVTRADDRPTYVVRYAIGALGDVCDPRPVNPLWRLSRHVELNLDIDVLFELYRTL
jgi:HEAT repeat protein